MDVPVGRRQDEPGSASFGITLVQFRTLLTSWSIFAITRLHLQFVWRIDDLAVDRSSLRNEVLADQPMTSTQKPGGRPSGVPKIILQPPPQMSLSTANILPYWQRS
jgi:hypothetical protein